MFVNVQSNVPVAFSTFTYVSSSGKYMHLQIIILVFTNQSIENILNCMHKREFQLFNLIDLLSQQQVPHPCRYHHHSKKCEKSDLVPS